MDFSIKDHTILLSLSGSRAYGTNIETSDYDYKGIAVPPLSYYFGYSKNFEQLEELVSKGHGADRTVYAIQKFFKLAAAGNPNILEIIFAPKDCQVIATPWSDMIVENRDLFLSKRVRYSYSGYAHSQLKRLRNHREWLLHPPSHAPTREEFGLPPENDKKIGKSNLGLIPALSDLGYSFSAEALSALQREKEYLNALDVWKKYSSWKKNRNKERSALEAKYGFDCYADDTEFLTADGWKKYSSVTVEDKLATVCMRSGITARKFMGVEYEHFTDRFDGIYNGPMYHLTGQHTDTLVTPNHRMLFRRVECVSKESSGWVLEEAACLPDAFDVLVAPYPHTKSYSNKSIFAGLPISDRAYMTLMGWYLSGGCVIPNREDAPKSVRVSQKKGVKLSRLMARWQGDYGVSARSSLYEYEQNTNGYSPESIVERVLDVHDKAIVEKMACECGDMEHKRIPRWVFNLSRRLMETLMQALLGCGGIVRTHKTKTVSAVYYSKSKTLADDVQELALMCGWGSALQGPCEYKDVEGRSCFMYQVHVRREVGQTRRFMRSSNVEKIDVQGQRIVCFTVPNGTLITRRKGKVGIHGNSKHGMHLLRLMRTAVEIFSGEGLQVRRHDREDLLAIRRGEWSLDRLLEEAEELEGKLVSLYDKSTLPNQPPVKKLDSLCAEVTSGFLLEHGDL